MSESLDVRLAIHEANSAFGRFPARISCLPVLLGVLYYAMTAWFQPDLQHPEDNHVLLYLLRIVVGGFVMFWVNCFIEVVVTSMYLRAGEGAEPGARQFGEALQYRGFASLAGGLLLRYFGWFLVIVVPLAIAIGVVTAILNEFTRSTGGISATAGGAGAVGQGNICVVMGILAEFIAAPIFCRYMFLFQMYAIERGSGRGFLDECVARTRQVWKTAAVVMVAGLIPAYLIMGIESLAWKHMTPPHWVHLAVEAAGALLTGCFTAWFILVKTGLAQQLMSAPLPVPTPLLADAPGIVNHIGPPPL
jgi:hypothetical protein